MYGTEAYSPECVEGEFCELRRDGVLGSSPLSLGLARPSTLCYRFRNGRSSALALLRNPNLARAYPWTGLAVRHEPWRGGRKAFGTRLCGGDMLGLPRRFCFGGLRVGRAAAVLRCRLRDSSLRGRGLPYLLGGQDDP